MTTPNPNSPSPPDYYGGLEVDTRQAGAGGGYDDYSKFRVADQAAHNAPQVYNADLPEAYNPQDYSAPQVVGAGAGFGAGAAAGAGLEAGYAHDQATSGYESGYYAPKEHNASTVVADEIPDKRSGTICGLRRKVFWILLVAAIIIVIGAAVGGGVGGALAAQNSSQQSDGSSSGSTGDGSSGGNGTGGGNGSGDGGSGDGGSSGNGTAGDSGDSTNSTSPMDILPTTNLGSLNFTDQYGFDINLVYYQLRSKVLMQSSWNSSTKSWSTVVGKSADDVKEATPISNSLFWHSKNTRDARIYYLNEKNQVAGVINGNPVYGFSWDKSGVSDTFTAAESSQMLSNGIYNPDSYLDNLVMYQDTGSTIRVLRRTGNGHTDWTATGVPTEYGKPALGTGLSLIPIYTTEAEKKMNLLYASESGSLIALTLKNVNGMQWANETLPTTVEKNASIAAFSSGYNNTDLTMHVLATQSDKAPVLTTYSGGQWTNEGEIESMSGDDRPVKIAANLAGRVYGLVERNNSKVEIVEWEWTGGTTYNKIGVVDVLA
ncbi:hypothetical protein C8034_v004605 [Colletotrichum sidae]|uniref:Uncharacterized protein n=1 Tax=Colletotrichum sidae TaxID=1347389 RepID=A0A4R8TU75_9PEZI|nr:hypothetical protein C8034_v004605 [Colletotrichum sidae]